MGCRAFRISATPCPSFPPIDNTRTCVLTSTCARWGPTPAGHPGFFSFSHSWEASTWKPQTKAPQATQACAQPGDEAGDQQAHCKKWFHNFCEISYGKTRGSYDHSEIASQCRNDGGYAKVSAGGNPRPGLMGASLHPHRQPTLPSYTRPRQDVSTAVRGHLVHNRCHSGKGRIRESRHWGRLAIPPFHPIPAFPFRGTLTRWPM